MLETFTWIRDQRWLHGQTDYTKGRMKLSLDATCSITPRLWKTPAFGCFVLFPALLYPQAATLMALMFPSSGFLLDHFENIHSHLLYITHSTSSPNSHLPGLAASWHCTAPKSFRLWSDVSHLSPQFTQMSLTFLPAWTPWQAIYNPSIPFPQLSDSVSWISLPILIINPHLLYFPILDPNHS